MVGSVAVAPPDVLSGAAAVLRIAEERVAADEVPVTVWSDEDIVEGVARWEAVEAIAHAQKQRLMAALAQRLADEAEELELSRSNGTVYTESRAEAEHRAVCWCAVEFAPVLRLSQDSAYRRVDVAIEVHDGLPVVWAAMNRGEFSGLHGRVFRDELAVLDDRDVAAAVAAKLVGAASGYTPSQLAKALRLEILKVDPEAAARRFRRKRRTRSVSAEMLDESIGILRAYLTMDELAAVMAVVDAYARLAAPGDTRTLDERRASVLVDLVTGGMPHNQGDDEPDPQDPTTQPTGVDETTATDEEILAALEKRLVDENAEPAPQPGPCRCGGRRERRDPFAGSPFGVRPRVGCNVKVIIGAGTLLGLDDQPAYIAGFGHVPAEIGRKLAADGTWRAMLADLDSGALLDAGRHRYRPSALLREFVQTRDQTCDHAGCERPIMQLDHVIPFPDGDTTGENLRGKCFFHHFWKTHSGCLVELAPDGTCTWTMPSGRRYQTKPPPIGGVSPPTVHLPRAAKPDYAEEPPF
jgi:hypothetical protein